MTRVALLWCLIVCGCTFVALADVPDDEKPPASTMPCFPGAIYRKCVSSEDVWTGIDATVTLPTLVTDPARVDENGKPLDNGSCYVGGRAGLTEIDAGVAWEVIREADGTVSNEKKAFRPFWRNKIWFSGPATPELYFYPGDTIRLVLRTQQNDKLIFRVELLGRKGEKRSDSGPISVHEVELDAPGWGPGRDQQFKRVTAIDQVHNEGKPLQATKAHVDHAVWSDVYLMRGGERREFVPARFTDMRCPSANCFRVEQSDSTAASFVESIDIIGSGPK